ncbi:unnamed protein product [Eruca vesicaria subsp. sativa]|uniref:Uncharacterized protein n=1 Tax=Eruca vesicaria subsp. sativa TaxID=29727 RepID=A0ABC8L0T0_ERUVS|nr:unnamed protein product [Eruca vesicaria subsp. sativa]
MTSIFSLFLVFTLFIVSLLIILALIVRPRSVKIPIKSRHVFITGGSSGIGLALAHLAVSEGARVSILARSVSKLADAKQSIKLATGVDVSTFSADVRDYDAVSKAVDQSGPIDVLIVNQGVFIGKELEKQSYEEVKFMIDVNLVGSFNVIKAALPSMKGRGPELKKRPELTSIIAASSGSMKTKEVAKICLDGIKGGKFTVTCHFIGYLLSIATSGMSPQRSFWDALMEVMFGGFVRFVGLFFQWGWYNTIEKWSNSKLA